MNMCVLVGLLLIYSGFGKTLNIQEHLSVIVKEITELRIETGRLRNENKALNQEVDILKAMLNVSKSETFERGKKTFRHNDENIDDRKKTRIPENESFVRITNATIETENQKDHSKNLQNLPADKDINKSKYLINLTVAGLNNSFLMQYL